MKKILFLLLIITGFTSCNDFLDTLPDNRTQIDNLEKVKALLVSAYPNRYYGASLESRCDGVVDHGITAIGQMSPSFQFNHTGFKWDEHSNVATADDTDSYWSAAYSAIASANHAIEAIDRLGRTKESLPYLGEALLCRAYVHFTLMTLFTNFFDEDNRDINPGIPYVTEIEEETNKQYSRGTVNSTFDAVKRDLEEGMKYVGTASAYTYPKFHFTKDAAIMLALRIAQFDRDYENVIFYANQLIPTPTRFAHLFDSNTMDTVRNVDGTVQSLPHPQDLAYQFAGANLFDWYKTSKQATSYQGVAQAFSNPDNSNVILCSEPYSMLERTTVSNFYIRYTFSYDNFVEIAGANVTGYDWALPTYSMGSGGTANSPSYLPKIYEDFKSNSINAGTGQPYIKIALFRLEEAILARAEAYAMLKEYNKSLHDMTMYVQRRVQTEELARFTFTRDKVVDYYTRKIKSTDHFLSSKFNASRFSTDINEYEGLLQRGLVLAVLDARRMEFLYEGMRWFDILRWNIPVKHTLSSGESSTLTPDDDRRVIQLPETTSLSGLKKNRYDNIPFPWK